MYLQDVKQGGGAVNEGCEGSMNWMYMYALLCSVNIMAAIYISNKISHGNFSSNDDDGLVQAEAGNTGTANDSSNTTTKNKSFLESMIENAMKKEGQHSSKFTTGTYYNRSKMSNVQHTLCYDTLVAIYIIVGIGYMIWLSVGVGKMGECGMGNVDSSLSNSIICGFAFITCGWMAFCCSLCCLVR